jgi:hypothetical protein
VAPGRRQVRDGAGQGRRGPGGGRRQRPAQQREREADGLAAFLGGAALVVLSGLPLGGAGLVVLPGPRLGGAALVVLPGPLFGGAGRPRRGGRHIIRAVEPDVEVVELVGSQPADPGGKGRGETEGPEHCHLPDARGGEQGPAPGQPPDRPGVLQACPDRGARPRQAAARGQQGVRRAPRVPAQRDDPADGVGEWGGEAVLPAGAAVQDARAPQGGVGEFRPQGRQRPGGVPDGPAAVPVGPEEIPRGGAAVGRAPREEALVDLTVKAANHFTGLPACEGPTKGTAAPAARTLAVSPGGRCKGEGFLPLNASVR